MRSKYKAVRTTIDGITFDSRHEANRYSELVLAQHAGMISRLELQPRFDIHVNGVYIAFYKADFRYIDDDGKVVIEDAKGVRTSVYRLKKKLVEAIYGIEIVEV